MNMDPIKRYLSEVAAINAKYERECAAINARYQGERILSQMRFDLQQRKRARRTAVLLVLLALAWAGFIATLTILKP